jgi:hypothetical protein
MKVRSVIAACVGTVTMRAISQKKSATSDDTGRRLGQIGSMDVRVVGLLSPGGQHERHERDNS